MTRFFTSDTHFGHRNILRYCDRPFSDVPHMNEMLIRNWNDTVAPEDTVYHMGDVALGQWSDWNNVLSRLNGNKILVIGNHDRVFEEMPIKQQVKFRPIYLQWFSEMTNRKDILLANGVEVNLSHFPYDGDHTDEARYMGARTTDRGVPLIHGHTHMNSRTSRSAKGTPQVHVGMDAWDYRPVSEDEVIATLEGIL